MTNLIATDLTTSSGINSGLVTLFTLSLPNGSKVRFYPGLDEDLSSIRMREPESPYTVKIYNPFPAEIDGFEMSADGAVNRPTLSVANIGTAFKDLLEGFSLHDLVGQRITKRQTLKKYLADYSTAAPPVEMNSMTYIVDRLASETNTSVTFELALVYDLEGVTLPRRVSTGKFCAWNYQGYYTHGTGGCTWPLDSRQRYSHTSNADYVGEYYFTVEDIMMVARYSADSAGIFPEWSSTTSYAYGTHVKYTSGNQVYLFISKIGDNSSNINKRPISSTYSAYWDPIYIWEHTYDEETKFANLTEGQYTSAIGFASDKAGRKIFGKGIAPETKLVSRAPNGVWSVDKPFTETTVSSEVYTVTPDTQYVASTSMANTARVQAEIIVNGKPVMAIWRCIKTHNSDDAYTQPQYNSSYWVREDLCGKTLNSCKCRFQGQPRSGHHNKDVPNIEKSNLNSLPFGAFLGTEKL